MRRLTFYTALFTTLFTATLLFGQQFWDKQDYHKWSKQDCAKLLQNSPWAQRWDLVTPVFAVVDSGRNTTDTEATSGRDSSLQINYVAQLRSVPIIRQAVVRMAMLEAKYDRMTPEQQKQIAAQTEKFLAVQFPDVVVVHVKYGSNIPTYDRQMAQFWQRQSLELVKNVFNLIGHAGRVAPIHYEVLPGAGREFEVTFPRFFNGQPLVTSADKTLALEFLHPAVGDSGSTRVFIPFKVKDMVRNGAVVF